jgi:hypothetical protein
MGLGRPTAQYASQRRGLIHRTGGGEEAFEDVDGDAGGRPRCAGHVERMLLCGRFTMVTM